nr:unnamed protein product [Callosobruchus analis]
MSTISEDDAERNSKYPEGFRWPANERALVSWVLGVMTVLQTQKTLLNLDEQTGGCAFTEYMLAYFLVALFVGIPVIFLEVYASQYSSRGSVSTWDICPLFRGIGYGKLLTLLLFQAYYNCMVALLLLYCVRSITERNSWRCVDDTKACFDLDGMNGTDGGYRTPAERFYLEQIANGAPQISQDWQLNWEWIGSVISSTGIAFLSCCLGDRFLSRMLAICLGVSVTQGLLLLCASSVTMGGLQGAERLVRSVQRVGWTQLLKPWRQHSTTLEAFRDLNIGIGIGLGMFSPIAATRPFRSGIHFIAVRLNFLHLEDLVLQSLLTANLYGILCHFADLDIGQMIGSGISDKRRTTMRPTPVTDLPNDIFTVLPHALAFLPGSDFLWIFIFFSSIFLRGVCCMALIIHAVVQEIHEWKPKLLRGSCFLTSLLVSVATTLLSCTIISTGGTPFICKFAPTSNSF